MLQAGRCERVILSAAVDFLPLVDSNDQDTVGLFGSGAAAVILEQPKGRVASATLRSLHWETHPGGSDLGHIPLLGHEGIRS